MRILAQIKAHRIMRVSFKFHSFVRFDGAPIISRYTHISKTEGEGEGEPMKQPHCNLLGIDVLESVIFYPLSST